MWLMEFNIDKCVCMHLGTKNIKFNYNLGLLNLKSAEQEKDLSMIKDENMKFLQQFNSPNNVVLQFKKKSNIRN